MVRSVSAMVRQNIRKWTGNPRYAVLCMALLVNFWHQMDGMAEKAASLKCGINVLALFPMLYCNGVGMGRIIMGAGILLLFCDAPFIDQNQQFVLARSGRTRFCVAQIAYIVTASALYTLLLVSLPILFALGRAGIGAKWGTLFQTIARDGNYILGNITVSPRMLEMYSVTEAFFFQATLFFLCTVFLGCVIFLFNLLTGKMGGLLVAGMIMVLGEFPFYFSGENWIYWISPFSFAEINHIARTDTVGYPPMEYAYSVLGISICLLMAAILWAFKRSRLAVKETL